MNGIVKSKTIQITKYLSISSNLNTTWHPSWITNVYTHSSVLGQEMTGYQWELEDGMEIEHNNRSCNLYNTDIGDEYLYIFSCEKLKQKGKRFLQSFYYNRLNTSKYQQLMNSRNKQTLSALSNLIKTIFETIKEN